MTSLIKKRTSKPWISSPRSDWETVNGENGRKRRKGEKERKEGKERRNGKKERIEAKERRKVKKERKKVWREEEERWGGKKEREDRIVWKERKKNLRFQKKGVGIWQILRVGEMGERR